MNSTNFGALTTPASGSIGRARSASLADRRPAPKRLARPKAGGGLSRFAEGGMADVVREVSRRMEPQRAVPEYLLQRFAGGGLAMGKRVDLSGDLRRGREQLARIRRLREDADYANYLDRFGPEHSPAHNANLFDARNQTMREYVTEMPQRLPHAVYGAAMGALSTLNPFTLAGDARDIYRMVKDDAGESFLDYLPNSDQALEYMPGMEGNEVASAGATAGVLSTLPGVARSIGRGLRKIPAKAFEAMYNRSVKGGY